MAELSSPLPTVVLGFGTVMAFLLFCTTYFAQTARSQTTEVQTAKEALQQANDSLEQRVNERTAELTNTNQLLTHEINERKRTQNELAQHTEELARSNAELENFAYIASHDLQEPLRMVASYTQLLAKRYTGKLDPTADEFIEFAVDGAKRMQALINDLLAYSRAGAKGKAFEPTDCHAIFARTVKNFQSVTADHGAQVTNDPLPTVMADATQFGQLFQNLIGNAMKFHGNQAPHVHVSAERNGEAWIFSVKDNGIGIDSKQFERVFKMFQRLHTKKEYAGTGIGLAICRKIVSRHGGRIWVESQPGQGTTFYFTIPDRREEKQRS